MYIYIARNRNTSNSLSVCHTSEPRKNGWTDRDAVSVEDSGGLRELCIRWGSRSPRGKGQFWGGKRWPSVKYRDTQRSPVWKRLNQSWCRLDCGLDSDWLKESWISCRVQIPHRKGQFWGKGSAIVKYRDFLPWAVDKRQNRSICLLAYGLGCAEGSTSSIVFARWREYAHMEEHIGAPGEYDWTVRLQRRYDLMSNYFVHLLLLGRIARTACIDAVHSYQPSSVDGRSVTLVNPANIAEAIDMPSGLRTRMAQGTMC